ncbi:M20/M25/M40 family metallo-hydrolase [Roseomonas marmotae]|uniref:M20/M25/M40 family metallo-hydrolase n=1 Tax=Roseomonas marmotae TaxID=2768161 RepID=A0ABS3KFF3_9PROT|nr:M20/M25/M40 family metallo-hydrolase [Roseomonas marmotae]MBO1076196.1 M20/M25/M40 family metallo-hydrolase [Roseomonas marmotae]QTI81768.1 M20/M25/M40 family metallo-hydrolase [Roseomonas marmotae]
MSQSNIPPFVADDLLREIRSWVEIESPTTDAAAVDRMMDKAAADAEAAGARVTRIPGRDGYGGHLLATSPWGEEDEPGILVLSHLDTVHAIGSLAGPLPFRVEGDCAYGPGIYDMKGGALIALAALRHLVRSGQRAPLPVRHLFVSDEEVGSHTSREHIEREARRARYVLVTEPAREGGRIVTARKGTARFDLKVKGKAAHSGARHEDGRSAVKELARQIIDLEAMTDYGTGVTVNVGHIGGGTRANVVPDYAWAEIDMRVPNQEIGEPAVARMLAVKPYDPDVTLEMTGGLNRPGYEKSDAIAWMFDHARGLAAEIGFDLRDLKTGGGSDGNFTAAMGVPTLDGLGVDGQDAHSFNERLFISSLVPRATLMLRLMETLS